MFEKRSKKNGDASQSSVNVHALKTEHLSEPLGVDTQRPRFRWLLDSSERGQLQTAYQILVASSLDALQSDIGDKWDSGPVESENSVEVVYDGTELASGERNYWKVRIWDQDGRRSAYSTPSFFEMGLLHADDWKGKWIVADKDFSSPLIRRDFVVKAAVRRARVYVSGLGYYELYLNGKKVGDRVLDPASTHYHNDQPFKLGSRILYSTYDVTADLQHGANVLGVMLGHGWYSAETDSEGVRVPYGDRPRLMLQMFVEYFDGQSLTVQSDSSWKASSGPISYNDLAHGEIYDARLEQPGWNRPGFDDRAWHTTAIAAPVSGALRSQMLPPIRVTTTLPVARIVKPKGPSLFDQTYIYDFGQNFSGWVRLTVAGPRGAKLVLRYGARLYSEDDTLDNRSNATPILGARQQDIYILKGEGSEIWEPRFTLHGFRYVEVRGFTDTPSVQHIEGRFVHSDVRTAGSFASSNELINKIHSNVQWTLLSSLQGIPQDAAERFERIGWLGDTGFVAEDYINNYETLTFWEKWLNDIKDSQKENGDISLASPFHWSAFDGYMMWPAWKSTYPLILWYLYQHYADRRVLEEHYTSLKRLVDFLTTVAKDHIIAEGLGDHMEPQENGCSSLAARRTPAALTSTAYYYCHVSIMAKIANVLDRQRDSAAYAQLAQEINAAFNQRFLETNTHQYAGGSQTSNALALYLELVPAEQISAVMKNLCADVIEKNYHVSTGIIGLNALSHALPKHGRSSLMYTLAKQETYPSLGHQVVCGATTLCETYECSPWLSQNMKMFGSIDKFFYRNLAGINSACPGYRKILIQPRPVDDLQRVSASQETIRGPIFVEWSKGNTSFDLKVSIPAGTQGEIAIPTLGLLKCLITEHGTIVWKDDAHAPGANGIVGAEVRGDAVILRVGSGFYDFRMIGTAY